MRKAFIETLINMAEQDENIYLVTADLGFSVLEDFKKKFPNRFINIGIAEQNAIGISAGLSLSGKTVYFYSIIPFVTMRCFEQVRVDLCYMNLDVRLVGIGAGYSYGPAGTTHHSIEDISIMRSLPNMKICCPGDPEEVKELVYQSKSLKGPIYFRLGKGGEPVINQKENIIWGKASIIKEGKDLAIITTSNMLEQGLKWQKEYKEEGIDAMLISMHTIKPFDSFFVKKLLEKKIPIITLEEHNIIGGLGSAVGEVIAESGCSTKFKRIAILDEYLHDIGSQNYLRGVAKLKDKPDFKEICKGNSNA